jgi:hypothetical protein
VTLFVLRDSIGKNAKLWIPRRLRLEGSSKEAQRLGNSKLEARKLHSCPRPAPKSVAGPRRGLLTTHHYKPNNL